MNKNDDMHYNFSFPFTFVFNDEPQVEGQVDGDSEFSEEDYYSDDEEEEESLSSILDNIGEEGLELKDIQALKDNIYNLDEDEIHSLSRGVHDVDDEMVNTASDILKLIFQEDEESPATSTASTEKPSLNKAEEDEEEAEILDELEEFINAVDSISNSPKKELDMIKDMTEKVKALSDEQVEDLLDKMKEHLVYGHSNYSQDTNVIVEKIVDLLYKEE